MARMIVIGIALLLVFCGTAVAQEKKITPEEAQAIKQQTMQMMLPMFGEMMKATMEAQLEVLANPATTEKLASYAKNYYEALIKKGFSKDDALRIVMAIGFPSLPAMQK